MKKVSTAVMKQGRNISQPTLTIGLDLGDRNSWYCVLDEAERNDSLLESANGSMATVATRRQKNLCLGRKIQNSLDPDRPSHGRRLRQLRAASLRQGSFSVRGS